MLGGGLATDRYVFASIETGVRAGKQPTVRLGGEPHHGPQDLVDTGDLSPTVFPFGCVSISFLSRMRQLCSPLMWRRDAQKGGRMR